MEKLSTLLTSLEPNSDRMGALEAVKPALSSLSRQELVDGLRDVSLLPVFDCLNSGETTLVQTACSVLTHLLSFTDPALVLERYGGLMMRGLTHPDNSVVLLIMKQLSRCVLDDELALLVVQRDMVSTVLEKLDSELEVATEVTSWVGLLAETPAGLPALSKAEVVAQLQAIASRSSILQMRVLDMMVRMATLGEEHLQSVLNTGFLQQLISILHTDDFLLKLNCVDLLTILAMAPHGQKYLESAGVLTTMTSLLEDCPNHPLADILLPGLVKFWGNLAHTRPLHIMTKYPAFLSALVNMVQSDDFTAQSIAFETIGYIGVSLEGKTALVEMGNKMVECIEKLEMLIKDSPTEVKIRAMNALASLIKLDKENQSPELLSLTEAWYRRVPSTMSLVTSIVKQPFLDLRLAAYQLLMVMVGQPWGRGMVMRQPGFCEFLMDRSGERDKRGREEKFRVVEAIVESREAKEILGPDMDMQMRLFVKQGPHYVQVQSQVAYEGE
eukprot:GFUD01003687.1.p1 GENE.GFUD01003687.1~~GFUD01003687.1.p1  ORF type:complete len:499 (-),score=180.28 GFUD01003687.1:555-2051(-)